MGLNILKSRYRWYCLALALCLVGCLGDIPGQANPLDVTPVSLRLTAATGRPQAAQGHGSLPADAYDAGDVFLEWRESLSHKRLPLSGLSWSGIVDDIVRIGQSPAMGGTRKSWTTGLKKNLASHGAFWLIFLALLGVSQYLLHKGRVYLQSVLTSIDKDRLPFRHLSLDMFQRSLLLTGATLLAYLYRLLASPVTAVPAGLRLLASVLMIVLFTRWARDFVTFWFLGRDWISESDRNRLGGMLTGVRYGAILYTCLWGLTETDGHLPALLGGIIEVSLLLWVIYFWKQVGKDPATRRHPVVLGTVRALSYVIAGGGLVTDLLGYGSFSIYWAASWGCSLVTGLWAGLFFRLLGEWRQQLKARVIDAPGDESAGSQPFKWVALQLSWLMGTGVLVLLLIIAWGGRQAVMVRIAHALTYPISIGEIRFSVMNVVYAVIVIVLTHTLARFWRHFLKKKILAGSGMGSGLQDSITMISIYAVWGFGIMLSLHTFGMGTSTLAFAFGALGIGLGFGLQNIFNNFISGIILLFERPIQVGDDIEINGTWATVKKINVRATVVETYDNSSIIIPNSEFISSQVTNWSFNDKRLRRSIDVGVAYGSDIESVRRILLEIAGNTQKVHSDPKPDVIFRDFGDSALIFRLRVWTDIGDMFTVETAIRFEIDRLFKENGIVIAFPQRDVHLHTVAESEPCSGERHGKSQP